MPIQQMLLGTGKPPVKYYIDDVFSMAPYKGTAANNTINNGINLSEDGGLVWLKNRSGSYYNIWHDTEQGVNKSITPQSAMAQSNDGSSRLNQFKTNGFRVGSDTTVNASGNDIMSWCFKKSQGFFDIVKWTGNSTARTINHNLKCIPGFIAVKSMTEGGNWNVYHRGVNQGINPLNYYLLLNGSGTAYSNVQPFTAVTDTGFSIIADDNNDEAYYMNKSGEDYQAYVFAGGESTAATATSVRFGSNYHLNPGTSSDFTLGTGDYTIEFWWKQDHTSSVPLFDNRTTGEIDASVTYDGFYIMALGPTSGIRVWWNNEHGAQGGTYAAGVWNHCAVTRSSNVTRIFINGELVDTESDQTINCTGNQAHIGGNKSSGTTTVSSCPSNANISNFRLVKGTALYTIDFKPTTEPLTNVTNTKLLCCQGSTTTAATVAPNTITAQLKANESGTITASSDSAFDDPAGFIFGETGDQNVIKTNYYIGNGDDTNGLKIELGFEPQFVWIKNISRTERWYVFDSMRRMDNSEMDNTDTSGRIRSDNSAAEVTDAEGINISAKGFKLTGNEDSTNRDGDTYIYIAVRASEGYVGKVPDAGTDVFSIDTGNSSSTIPSLDSNFAVDFAFIKEHAGVSSWQTGSRLTGNKMVMTDSTQTEAAETPFTWDSNAGWATGIQSYKMSWMWKRHAGFDVLAYKARGGTVGYAHSLGKIPEMIWVKRRDGTNPWSVYHKGLNGGSSPEGYGVQLNTGNAEASSTSRWANTAPTSTHFFAGGNTGTNAADSLYIAMLFASVDGISKVGTYSGSSGDVSVTTGFQPRLVILKRFTGAAGTGDWYVYDTTRGFTGSGDDDKALKLNSSAAQTTLTTGTVTSTGFTITMQGSSHNSSGSTYLYYAHA